MSRDAGDALDRSRTSWPRGLDASLVEVHLATGDRRSRRASPPLLGRRAAPSDLARGLAPIVDRVVTERVTVRTRPADGSGT